MQLWQMFIKRSVAEAVVRPIFAQAALENYRFILLGSRYRMEDVTDSYQAERSGVLYQQALSIVTPSLEEVVVGFLDQVRQATTLVEVNVAAGVALQLLGVLAVVVET